MFQVYIHMDAVMCAQSVFKMVSESCMPDVVFKGQCQRVISLNYVPKQIPLPLKDKIVTIII